MWYGFDPGGTFGVAKISGSGDFECKISRSIAETCAFVEPDARGLGIDSILWWTRRQGGSRHADDIVRRTCIRMGGSSGTVSSINSLQGAMFVPAYLIIGELRRRMPNLLVTEAHPKAILRALGLPIWRPKDSDSSITDGWAEISRYFRIQGAPPETEHERDAIIAAVCAREGAEARWTTDLACNKPDDEVELDTILGGPVHYYWPTCA